MNNILQFLNNNTPFPTREAAIAYIESHINPSNPPLSGLIAEPIVVKYGTSPNFSIILSIGINGHYYYIDQTNIQNQINTINTTLSSSGTQITTIQTDIATINNLLDVIINSSGLNTNPKGQYIDTTGLGATSLANADQLLLNEINTLITNINNGTQKAQPIVSVTPNNLIHTEIDNGIAVKVDSFNYEPTTGILTLSFNNVATPYTVNLGLNVIGFQSITFDSSTESLVIVYQTTGGGTQTITVPISGMFTKWDVNNPINNTVVLTKTLGGVGIPDLLSGDIKIDNVHPRNILIKDPTNGSLYVDGNSDNIKFNGSSTITVTDKFNSVATDINNAITTATNNAASHTAASIAIEATNTTNAINNAITTANQYTDSQITTVSSSIANVQANVINETNRAMTAELGLQTQINALPTVDTRIMSGETLNNGAVLRLHYGTSTNPTMGYFDIQTSAYVQNPDNHLTSGIVASDGSTLTINYGTGLNQGSIIIPTSTYMDNIYINSVVVNDGMDNPPNYHPKMVFTYSNGSIVVCSLDTLAGARGIDTFTFDGVNLFIHTMDGTNFSLPISSFLGNYVTTSQLNAQLALKQDKLIAGTNISLTPMVGGVVIDTIASGSTGTVTAISPGVGMDFSPITGTGAVALGMPSTVGAGSNYLGSNSVSGTTHTHRLALNFNIADYSTTNDMNTAISAAISSAQLGLGIEGPFSTINDIPTPYQNSVIYLIGTASPFDEYITLVDGSTDINDLELIGSTTVDLSDYFTKAETNTAINDGVANLAANVYTKDQADNKFTLWAGNNITLTPNTTGVGVNISAITSGSYTNGVGLNLSGNQFSLTTSGVTAGTYNAGFSVDSFGRITSAANIPLATGTVTGLMSASDKLYIDSLANTTNGAMLKSIYDTNNDGIVDKTTVLATARDFSLTGDVTASTISFNGSANVALATTLSNSGVTAGTYTKITVDTKGRVTSGASIAIGDLPSGVQSNLTLASTALQSIQKGVDSGSGNVVSDIAVSGNTITLTKITALTSVPMASSTVIGGIRVGAGLAIDGSGILSATGGGVADSVAWANVVGRPFNSIGTGLNVTSNTLSINSAYIQNMINTSINAALANLVTVVS